MGRVPHPPPGASDEAWAEYDTYLHRLECLLWWVTAVPLFILAAFLVWLAASLV